MMIYTTTHKGHTATRRSDGHLQARYTHAVWTRDPQGKWHCQAFASRLDLAQKQLASFAKFHGDAAIAPVTAELKPVKHKPGVDFPGESFKLAGVLFEKDQDGYFSGRRGAYKGWEICVRCTGKVFSAVIYPANQPDNWNVRHYVANGGLESRVVKAKEIIDGLPPLHN